MTQVVLLRFEVVIRSYGAASTRIRRELGWIKKAQERKEAPAVPVLEAEESGFVRVRRRSWARLIQKVWLDDPELCPRCGERMMVLAAISTPAQDQVIEKILRARGEWDPPWLRVRLPRGPPEVAPRNAGQGAPSSGETHVEYEDGFIPGQEEEETGPGGEIASEGLDGA